MKFPIYPDWKAQLQMFLGREIASGGETEYIWKLYDLHYPPEDAAQNVRRLSRVHVSS